MRIWHPWAAFLDYVGNLWCALAHFPKHWHLKRHEYYERQPASRLGQLLWDYPIYACQCGRDWLYHEGAYTALTFRRLDAARAIKQ